jgi:hypothetical protein
MLNDAFHVVVMLQGQSPYVYMFITFLNARRGWRCSESGRSRNFLDADEDVEWAKLKVEGDAFLIKWGTVSNTE